MSPITECLKKGVFELTKGDPDFQEFSQGEIKSGLFTIQDGYLFKGNKLCIPYGP